MRCTGVVTNAHNNSVCLEFRCVSFCLIPKESSDEKAIARAGSDGVRGNRRVRAGHRYLAKIKERGAVNLGVRDHLAEPRAAGPERHHRLRVRLHHQQYGPPEGRRLRLHHLRGRSAHPHQGQFRHQRHRRPEGQGRGHHHRHHLGPDAAQEQARRRRRVQGSHGKDHADSFLLLESGRADAFVMDGSILAANAAKSKNPKDFKIVGEVLSVEPIACMLPKGDAKLKKAVDDSIVRQIKDGSLAKLYDKWFTQPIPPNNVNLNMPVSEGTKAAWANPNDKPMEAYAPK
ncbi:bacterial extracellular solute-binding protein, family 3 domain-containing protein [Ditylenchus destructor]|uniref:Bacterial extracellular solute-binding protein, family 3 domain-containing protein n=1 Tax=Ditylenchus destructor TaxID=166010 RepID=A0AAD4MKQ6_9BILA|nr:bacterial extracellular solute-binding protein, family 3 domain-containing protein [Ditylenchus destructor]